MNSQLKRTKVISIGTTIALLILFCGSTLISTPAVVNQATTDKWPSDFRPHGAYADEIVFEVFTEGEIPLAMLALQNGDIESYDDRVLSDYLAALVRDPNIEITFTLGVRYRTLNLNCARFPTNITAYRRAMAYAFDKYQANIEAVGGVGVPLDSYIPIVATTWEVESEVGGEFYDRNIEAGNASLQNAGFIDFDGDGWREYDANHNGVWDAGIDKEDTECAIELNPTLDYSPAIVCCTIAAEGLALMGMHGTVVEMDFGLIGDNMETGDYWVSCWTEGVSVLNTVKLLYDNFRTGGPYEPYYYHFSNATVDAYLDQMVDATDLDDVQAAALEASKLLAYEQPQIVCYNDAIIGAYRVGDTTEWTGYFEVPGLGWTHGDNSHLCTKIHQKGDTLAEQIGGSYHTCLSDNMNTLNCHMQTTGYEATVFQYLYEALWQIDPYTWQPMPQLAYDWEVEATTEDVEAGIQDGEKYTFYLYENETWHDGTPFTALDVNFTFQEIWPGAQFYPTEAEYIYKYVVPDNYTIEMYINRTGYFLWSDATGCPYIVPMHIWKDVAEVETFNPTDEQMIGTGPYKWNDRIPGQYISLLRHDGWRWDIRDKPIHTTTTTTTTTTVAVTTTTTTTTTTTAPIDAFAIIAGLGTVVLMTSIRRRKK